MYAYATTPRCAYSSMTPKLRQCVAANTSVIAPTLLATPVSCHTAELACSKPLAKFAELHLLLDMAIHPVNYLQTTAIPRIGHASNDWWYNMQRDRLGAVQCKPAQLKKNLSEAIPRPGDIFGRRCF